MDVFFPWISSFATGVEPVDSQHKKLVEMINTLFDAMNNRRGAEVVGNILDEMFAYAATHFATEEALFEKYEVADREEHKKEHDLFREQLDRFQENRRAGRIKLTVEVAEFLKDWLKHHILQSDRKSVALLRFRIAEQACLGRP
jgi:hemerythrin-like metal-binding protein